MSVETGVAVDVILAAMNHIRNVKSIVERLTFHDVSIVGAS
jgi:hypothetical protein